MQLLSSIYSNKVTSYMNGHDHAMAVGNPQQAGVPQAYAPPSVPLLHLGHPALPKLHSYVSTWHQPPTAMAMTMPWQVGTP